MRCFRYLILLALVMTSGCLPDQQNVRESENFERRQADLQQSALAVLYQTNAARQAVTTDNGWRNGTMDNGTMAELGLDPGTGAGSVALNSGYCKDVTNPTTPRHFILTWLDSRDADGGFSMKGQGASAAAGLIRNFSTIFGVEQAGIIKDGVVELAGMNPDAGTNIFTFPAGCNLADDIPDGAPLVITYFDRGADTFMNNTAGMEYTVEPCPSGTGSIMKMRYRREWNVQLKINEWDDEGTYEDTCM